MLYNPRHAPLLEDPDDADAAGDCSACFSGLWLALALAAAVVATALFGIKVVDAVVIPSSSLPLVVTLSLGLSFQRPRAQYLLGGSAQLASQCQRGGGEILCLLTLVCPNTAHFSGCLGKVLRLEGLVYN